MPKFLVHCTPTLHAAQHNASSAMALWCVATAALPQSARLSCGHHQQQGSHLTLKHAAHCMLVCLQVQKLLGKGSYGIVYRVKRKSDGVVYALKEADVRKMSPVERMDAVNEIRLLASVRHQNVVRYHEAFLDGESGCLACRQCWGCLTPQHGGQAPTTDVLVHT